MRLRSVVVPLRMTKKDDTSLEPSPAGEGVMRVTASTSMTDEAFPTQTFFSKSHPSKLLALPPPGKAEEIPRFLSSKNLSNRLTTTLYFAIIFLEIIFMKGGSKK